MAKFNSIWGDLEVREENITPVAPPATPPTPTPSASVAKENEGEEEEEGDIAVGAATVAPASTPAKEPSGEEDEYEFSEDDVSKAYTMLEEEGVLELGEDDEFENSPQGLAAAVATTVKNKLAKEIAAIPKVVQDFYSHVMEGKNPTEFVAEGVGPTWAEFELATEDDEVLVLEELYRAQGMTEEEIEEEIQDLDPDKRAKKAAKALDVLIKQEEKTVQEEAIRAAQEEKQAEQARLKEIQDLKTTIDTIPEIAGFTLDAPKRAAFKDYLFKVNPRTGKTQMQENMSSEERRLTIAYLDFINYNKADVEKAVATELTKERKKKLSRYTDKNVQNSNSSGVVKTKTNKSAGSIVFPSIFGTQKIEIED